MQVQWQDTVPNSNKTPPRETMEECGSEARRGGQLLQSKRRHCILGDCAHSCLALSLGMQNLAANASGHPAQPCDLLSSLRIFCQQSHLALD